MKSIFVSTVLALSTSVVSSVSCAEDEKPIIKGPYLGQTPPGITPELFAPGIVNTEAYEEKEGMFAGDMKSFYFVRGDKDGPARQLIAYKYKNDQWRPSVVIEGETEPSFSPDGKTLYFQNKYMEHTDDGWSELKSLDAPLGDVLIMRPTVATSGTLYFDTFSPPAFDIPLRYSRLIDGKYEEPKSLGKQFAVGRKNAHPYIAPDESYILWDARREGGQGSYDIYISYRAEDGSWGPAINIGDKINSPDSENYPSVSPDGKYLFFDRRTGTGADREVAIYWVDAGFIEDLRPKQ